MSSQYKNKGQYSRKILKILAQKPAVPVTEITTPEPLLPKEGRYALSRSLRNLVEAGYAEMRESDNQSYVKITQKGKTKLDTIRLLAEDALVPQTWDSFWRIIILDLPEERKSEREALRYLLKKANFVCVKNTVWISPYPYENIFMNIKKDLGFTTELMILVTDKIDPETHQAFLKSLA